jgi:hypothetical protein
MDKVRTLTKLLKSIHRIAKDITQKSVDLMKVLEDPENDIVDEIHDQIPHIPKLQILQTAQNASLTYVDDSKRVLDEIDKFIQYSDSTMTLNHKECTFLSQVWHGDFYGTTELEGLFALKADLEKQLDQISEDHLIKTCICTYTKEKPKT